VKASKRRALISSCVTIVLKLLEVVEMLSPVDTAVICGLALLLFGPKKFPEIGRALGQGLGNFKKALTEAQDEAKTALKTDEKPKTAVSEEEQKSG
jgi:sec-independent protein translocase protein TatA